MSEAASRAGGDRSHAIDALRALAAGAVLVYHAAGLPGAQAPATGVGHVVMRNLNAGVVLFFVVSGYLISRPFVVALVDGATMPDLRRYAVRRACRILPSFWVALAAVVLLVRPGQSPLGAAPLTAWWQVPLHGLLLLDVVPGQMQQLLKVAWTLEDELIFYVLVAVVALVLMRRHRAGMSPGRLAGVVLGTWLASALVALAADQLPAFTDGAAVARYTFPAVACLFCPGILVAIAQTRAAAAAGGPWSRWRRFVASPARWVPAGVALCVLALASWEGELTLGGALPRLLDQHWQVFALAFGVMVGGVVAGGRGVDRVTRWLAPVGVVSYGIYLWHTVVVHALATAGLTAPTGGGTWLTLGGDVLIVAAFTLPLAAASWFLVERPALRWAAARRRRVPEPEPAPVAVVTG